jgi:hypothetical protein
VTVESPAIEEARSLGYLFHRQHLHLIALLVLLSLTWAFGARVLGDGAFLGIRDLTWFGASLALAIIHQVYVWLVFRLQLGWGLLTRWFGRADLLVWAALFIPLLLARPLLLAAVGLADAGSLLLPDWIRITMAIAALCPAVYTIWSVVKYFGLVRALVADHFRPRYREMGLVRDGAFRWTPNAMYAFAFLFLWALALFLDSQAALALALFQHAYIWVHYYCVEAPDMALIYGSDD